MPQSQHDEIASKFDGEQAKLEMVKAWLAGHPFPTWEAVRKLLGVLEVQGRGRAGAAEEVEETYLKSEFYYQSSVNMSTCGFTCFSLHE